MLTNSPVEVTRRLKLNRQKVAVCGAGGFIGGQLVTYLLNQGVNVARAVDSKPLEHWYQKSPGVENRLLDLSDRAACTSAVDGMDVVFNLASEMGGMGFIEANKARCMLNVLINTHLLLASRDAGIQRFFFASSACVYNREKQSAAVVQPLKEEDAYPALPEDGYGWEKLFSERMCRHFQEDFALPCRIARYHNVYGPYGTYRGGHEKAPAALCRKPIEAKMSRTYEIEIWGDGTQTRSFMYIDDCMQGTHRILESDISEPLNLGSSELVSINQLVDMIEDIAKVKLKRTHKLNAATGVQGRNSDNSKIRRYLDWEPSFSLKEGLERTYHWIERELRQSKEHVLQRAGAAEYSS